jgi:hypothetical protein
MVKIKSEILIPHVYLFNFDSQYDLCMSFVRMQEFYESDSNKFRGKYFTLEKYMDYWSKKFGKGVFTYTKHWNGFNLPGKKLKDWVSLFDDVRDMESDLIYRIDRFLMKEFGSTFDNYDKMCVIGIHTEGDKEEAEIIKNHELAHALYCLYPEYKKSCDKLLKTISNEENIKNEVVLLSMGYCKKVIKDELQAYYSTDGRFGTYECFIDNFESFKNKLKKN